MDRDRARLNPITLGGAGSEAQHAQRACGTDLGAGLYGSDVGPEALPATASIAGEWARMHACVCISGEGLPLLVILR
jgi:hypothetical protein